MWLVVDHQRKSSTRTVDFRSSRRRYPTTKKPLQIPDRVVAETRKRPEREIAFRTTPSTPTIPPLIKKSKQTQIAKITFRH